MSVKALEAEYKKVCDQYFEMKNDIKDIEKEVAEGIVDPEFIDRLKEQIKPIKQNYEWWTWVMYILHQPQRKQKIEKYKKMNNKRMSSVQAENSCQARLNEGQEALNNLKSFK